MVTSTLRIDLPQSPEPVADPAIQRQLEIIYNAIHIIHETLTNPGEDSDTHFHSSDRERANHTGTQLAGTISDFDTEVSSNADVAANTAARHVAVTVADTATVNLTLAGQQLTADADVAAINYLSAVQATDLTDAGDSTLHYHAADRALANITGLGANVATFLATPSSANLAAAVTGETGSGALVFADTATLVNLTVTAASGDALTVTNTGIGNSFVVNDEAGDTTPFIIDNAGRIGLGITPVFKLDAVATTTALGGGGFQLTNSVNNLNAASFRLRKSRGALGAETATSSGDYLGTMHFDAHDGTSYVEAVRLTARSDATPTTGVAPGRYEILTANASGVVTEALHIGSDQSVLAVSPTGGLGYGAGAGGVVTQLTSKSTGVTLNNAVGAIIMNGAALAAGATVNFVFSNSVLVTQDLLLVNTDGFPIENYSVQVGEMAAGSCTISVTNKTAGSLSNALILRFAVIKAVTS